MNTKAMAVTQLGKIIVAVVVLLVVLVFILKIIGGTDKIIEDSECKSSIEQHAFLVKTTGEAIVPDIYCPTKYPTLSGSDEKQTKQELADAMKTCWGMWGRGQLQLFKEEGYYCHICYVIDFKEEDKKITDFADYLVTAPIPNQKSEGVELTYFDYLTGYASQKAAADFAQEYRDLKPTGTIDTSKTYSVMFLYAKGDKFIKSMLEGVGSVTGSSSTFAGGAVLGAFGGGLIAGGGAALLGASAVATGGATIIGAAVIGVAGAILGWAQANQVEWFSVTILQEYNAENLKKIGCKITPVKQEKDTG